MRFNGLPSWDAARGRRALATYRYDAKGDRVEKDVAGGVFERYVLSKAEQTSNGIACWHVVAVYGASDSWKQTFVFADEIDAVVMLEQKDVLDFDSDGNTTELTRSFYHGNALGSVMAISDMNQAVAVSYRYDPYGKVTITRNGQPQTTDPLGQHWGFTGRFLDEESGLNYYRARYYDPTLGRFVQRDPLGYVAGPSLYAYVSSSPQNATDPPGVKEFNIQGDQIKPNLEALIAKAKKNGQIRLEFWLCVEKALYRAKAAWANHPANTEYDDAWAAYGDALEAQAFWQGASAIAQSEEVGHSKLMSAGVSAVTSIAVAYAGVIVQSIAGLDVTNALGRANTATAAAHEALNALNRKLRREIEKCDEQFPRDPPLPVPVPEPKPPTSGTPKESGVRRTCRGTVRLPMPDKDAAVITGQPAPMTDPANHPSLLE